MQLVNAGFTAMTASAYRKIKLNVQIAWQKVLNPSVSFFTIGTSLIGGADVIRSENITNPTFFDKFQYSDYTKYIKTWSVSRKVGNYPWGVFMAQADIQLDNTDKSFLPSASGLGPYILPGRPLKISVGFNGEAISQFVGFSDQPQSSLVTLNTNLHSFDAIDYLNKVVSQTGVQVGQTTTQIITTLLTEAGFDSTQWSLESSLQKVIGYYCPYNKTIGNCIAELAEAEQGLFFVSEQGVLTFWNRQHLPNNVTSRFTFSYSNSNDMQFENTAIINDVVVTSKPREVSALQKIWENSQAVAIPAGATLDVWASFTDSYGEMPTPSVDTPVYISDGATSYYSTNIASDGSGLPYNAYISVYAFTNFGNVAKITFQNTFTSPIYVTGIALYGTPAKVSTVIQERYSDQTSINTYGRNPQNNGQVMTIDNNVIQDRDTARSISYMLVTDNKTPNRRMKIPTFAVPQLQIGDVVTVNILDTGETKDMFIMGITNSGNSSGLLKQDLIVDYKSIIKYFTIGTSLIGGTDGIAP